MKIGALTIGQSPRTDVTPEFLEAFGADVELVQKGALDAYTLEDIRKLEIKNGDYMLVTRMRDGTEVKITERFIHERMHECVRELEDEGVEVIVIFCTGEFPDIESKCLILKPDNLLAQFVPAVLPKGKKLGAVLPSPAQIPVLGDKWRRLGFETAMVGASPYTGTDAEFEAAAKELKERGVDLIVLDCIGFTGRMKRIFKEATGIPVILPRTLLGRVAAELAGRV